MTVSKKTVIDVVSAEEIDCKRAEDLGMGAFPHLLDLVRGDDELIASRAVWVASRIDGNKMIDIIKIAANREDPLTRVAAAYAANSIKGRPGDDILNKLKTDKDEVVRAKAAKFIAKRK